MMESTSAARLQRTLLCLAALLCAVFLLVFLLALYGTAWPGPYNDYWADMDLVRQSLAQGLHWTELVTAHNNAHRIVIPRLLFILDYQWFQGSNTLILAVGLACKGLLWLLFNQAIRQEDLRVRLLLNLLIFAALFNLNGIYNIQYSSNIQWDLMLLFCCFAVYFHQQALNQDSWPLTATAYVCLLGGLLTHAGTLAVLPVFLLFALSKRDSQRAALALLASASLFWLTFYVLPVSDPGEPTYQPALFMLIIGIKTVAYFVFNLLDSGLRYHIGPASYYFSATLLCALAWSLLRMRRTSHIAGNLFLAIALFCVLGMIEIAAARSAFTPKQWASSRFHGFSLLFILCLSSHLYLSLQQRWQKYLVCGHALLILLLVQYASYRDAFGLANKVFQAQAYMFSHQRNQFDGDKLVTFFNENDRVAAADPFFTANDLAYYTNKQAKQSPWPDLVPMGQTLLKEEQRAITNSCDPLSVSVQSKPDEEGQHLELAMSVNSSLWQLRHLLFLRNTYYLVDEQGVVSGFVYLWLDPEKPWARQRLHGFANNTAGKYLMEIDSGEARCLAAL